MQMNTMIPSISRPWKPSYGAPQPQTELLLFTPPAAFPCGNTKTSQLSVKRRFQEVISSGSSDMAPPPKKLHKVAAKRRKVAATVEGMNYRVYRKKVPGSKNTFVTACAGETGRIKDSLHSGL
eukprot:scaffold142967_cov27-Attheya_sp.AAC.3